MTLAVVLLAGGESRRMGRDKAWLEVDGRPLWRHQLDLLRKLAPAALLVSARQVPAWLENGEARFIPDASPSRGPLSGLVASLGAMSQSHLLALAIDMPSIGASHLRDLWREASPGCGVLPEFENQVQPLPAIYPAEAAPVAAEILAGEDVSLRHLAEALAARGMMKKRRIPPEMANLYMNLNSPADWQTYASSR